MKPEIVISPVKGIIKHTFDRETVWSNNRRKVEAAADGSGWSEQEKITALILAFRGKALQILPIDKQKYYASVMSP